MKLGRRQKMVFKILGTLGFLVLTLSFILAPNVFAQINRQINYQGKMDDSSGNPVADGGYNFHFELWNSVTGGTKLWEETWSSTSTVGQVAMTKGLFSIYLGSSTPISPAIFNSGPVYLRVLFDPDGDGVFDQDFSPRKRLSASPYAFNSEALNGFSATTTATANYIPVFDGNAGLTLGGITTTGNIISQGDLTVLGSSTFGTLNVTNLVVTNNIDLGVVSTGTWQAAIINPAYGGTGQDTSGWTGFAYINSGTWTTTTLTGATLSGFNPGEVIFGSSTGSLTSNPNFYWDDINRRLTIIGNTTTASSLIIGSDTYEGPAYVEVNSALNRAAGIRFSDAGVDTWAIWKINDGSGDLEVYNDTLNTSTMRFTADGKVGIGTVNPLNSLHVVETGTFAAFFDVFSGDSSTPIVFPSFSSRVARGTQSTPLALQTGDILTALGAQGYNGSAYSTGGHKAYMAFFAANNWTTTSEGTYIAWATTPIGTTTRAERMRISDLGNIGIGTTTPNERLTVSGNAYITGTTTATCFTVDGINCIAGGSGPESDPIFASSVAATITTTTISQWTNNVGYITSTPAETDPIWTAASASYLTVLSASNTYLTIAHASNTYQLIGNYLTTTTGLTVSNFATNTISQWYNNAGYLTSITGLETDPIFASSAAYAITTTSISDWNTAYGWGNHASAGYLTTTSAASLYLATSTSFGGDVSGNYGNLQVADNSHNHDSTTISNLVVADFASPNISQWTNNVGYITSTPAETDPIWTAASASYLTVLNASNTYLTIANASNTYQLIGNYLTTSSNLTVANFATNTISQWYNNVGYLTGLTAGSNIVISGTSTIAVTSSPIFAGTLTVDGLTSSTYLMVSANVTTTDLVALNSITLGGVTRTNWPSGGSGGGGFWETSSNGYIGYPNLPAGYTIVIGASVTSSNNLKLEIVGNTKLDGDLLVTGDATITALTLGTLNGLLYATNGAVSTITTSSLGLLTSETDPIWMAASTSYLTVLDASNTYQLIGNYLTTSSNLTVANFVTDTISQWYNDAGYITSTLGFMASGTDYWVNITGDTMTGNLIVSSSYIDVASTTLGYWLGGQKFMHIPSAWNTAVGVNALSSHISGTYNTAIGYYALKSDTYGSINTAIGGEALYSNVTGTNNTAVGVQALHDNTGGHRNTAVGVQALYSNTIGEENVAIGQSSLLYNTTGYNNTAVGSYSLLSNDSGYNNIAVGHSALMYNVSGTANIAIGANSLFSNISGSENYALGQEALYSNETGWDNAALGYQSLYSNLSGNDNVALGTYALFANETGSENTAVGTEAGIIMDGGINNTFLGFAAGDLFTNGDNNTFLGALSGNNIASGTNNIIIGYNIGAPVTTTSNFLNIGNTIYGDLANNYISIGTTTLNQKLTVAGNAYITGTTTASCFTMDGVNCITSSGSETDPIFASSAAYAISTSAVSNWNTAYGWGNHASAGYLTTTSAAALYLATSTSFGGDVTGYYGSLSVSDNSHNHDSTTISNLVVADFASQNISQWTNNIGYITTTTLAGAETDPIFSSSAAYAITTTSISNWDIAYNTVNNSSTDWTTAYNIVNASSSFWDTAYNWGNHASAGYLTTTSAASLYLATSTYFGGDVTGYYGSLSVSDNSHNHDSTTISNLVVADFATSTISQWTNDIGYITTTTLAGAETDPIFASSAAYAISTSAVSNWNTAYGWGNHASAGYLTTTSAASLYLATSTAFGGDVTGYYGSLSVSDNSHNHDSTTISNLVVADFASQDISQWTNNIGYITNASATDLYVNVTGDTMTGALIVNNNITATGTVSSTGLMVNGNATTTNLAVSNNITATNDITAQNGSMYITNGNLNLGTRQISGAGSIGSVGVPWVNLFVTNVSTTQVTTTALQVNGNATTTGLLYAGSLQLDNLTGLLYATNGAVSTITTSSLGLLASETDPVFSTSAAAGISSGNISNWNTAYGWGNHASSGYLTSFTLTPGSNIVISGTSTIAVTSSPTFTGNLTVNGLISSTNLVVGNNVTTTDLIALNSITLGGISRTSWPSGGSGGGGFWETSSNSLIGYPNLLAGYTIVIGASVTSSNNLKLEVAGNTKLGGDLNVTGNATITSLTIDTLNGLLYATNGAVSTITTSSLGLLASETDPVFSTSAAATISTTSITNWTTAYNIVNASSSFWDTAYNWGNHASAGYLTTTSAASLYLATSTYFGGDVTGYYGSLSVSDNSHNHDSTTISNLVVADFATSTISQWTNDIGYITNASATDLYVNVTGDTMTGALIVNNNITATGTVSSTGLRVNGNSYFNGNTTTTGQAHFGSATEYINIKLEPYRVSSTYGNIPWLSGRSLNGVGGINVFGMDTGLFIRETGDGTFPEPTIAFLDNGDIEASRIYANTPDDSMKFEGATGGYNFDNNVSVSGNVSVDGLSIGGAAVHNIGLNITPNVNYLPTDNIHAYGINLAPQIYAADGYNAYGEYINPTFGLADGGNYPLLANLYVDGASVGGGGTGAHVEDYYGLYVDIPYSAGFTYATNTIGAYIGGNVGIGVLRPTVALDVAGTVSSTRLQVNGNATVTSLTLGTLNGLLFATNGVVATITTSSLGLLATETDPVWIASSSNYLTNSSATATYLTITNASTSYANLSLANVFIASTNTFNAISSTALKIGTLNGFIKGNAGVFYASSAIDLATEVSGTLGVAHGGTGTTTAGTAGSAAYWDGSALRATAIGTAGQLLQSNAAGAPTWVSTSSLGITASAAGSNGQIQFNNGGALGASANLNWDSANNILQALNVTSTNATSTNLNATNFTFTGATGTSLNLSGAFSAANLSFTNATGTGSLSAATVSTTNLRVGVSTFTNLLGNNLYLNGTTLAVTSTPTFTSSTIGILSVTSSANIAGTLTVNGISTLATTTISSLTVSGNATTTGNQVVSGNLTVGGNTTLATTTISSTTISTANVGSFFQTGLNNCNGTNDKIVYSSTTGRFSCATDQTGAGGSGSIGSVVKASSSATITLAATETSTVSAIITPGSTTTLTWINIAGVIRGDTSAGNTFTVIVRRGSCTSTAPAIGPTLNLGTKSAGQTDAYSASIIDSPATTSAVTYSVCVTGSGSSVSTAAEMVLSLISAGADLAEVYYTNESDITPGSMVSIDPTLHAGVKKSTQAYDASVLGIISTKPGMVLADYSEGTPVLVALSGRVPVKVSTKNGAIKSGDYLTTSDIPGVAMKATRAGTIIGQAIADYDGEEIGSVMVFIKNGYYNGQTVIVKKSSTTPELDQTWITVSDSSDFQGSIKVAGDAEFAGKVTVAGQITVGEDTAGQAKILAGDTSVKVTFVNPYATMPIVNVTPLGRISGQYWVEAAVATDTSDTLIYPYFTLTLADSQNSDVTFNWQALASAETAKVSVSDETSELINIRVSGGEENPEEVVLTPEEPVDEPDLGEDTATATDPVITSDTSTPAIDTTDDSGATPDTTGDTSVEPVTETPADDSANPSENTPTEPTTDVPATESAPAAAESASAPADFGSAQAPASETPVN